MEGATAMLELYDECLPATASSFASISASRLRDVLKQHLEQQLQQGEGTQKQSLQQTNVDEVLVLFPRLPSSSEGGGESRIGFLDYWKTVEALFADLLGEKEKGKEKKRPSSPGGGPSADADGVGSEYKESLRGMRELRDALLELREEAVRELEGKEEEPKVSVDQLREILENVKATCKDLERDRERGKEGREEKGESRNGERDKVGSAESRPSPLRIDESDQDVKEDNFRSPSAASSSSFKPEGAGEGGDSENNSPSARERRRSAKQRRSEVQTEGLRVQTQGLEGGGESDGDNTEEDRRGPLRPPAPRSMETPAHSGMGAGGGVGVAAGLATYSVRSGGILSDDFERYEDEDEVDEVQGGGRHDRVDLDFCIHRLRRLLERRVNEGGEAGGQNAREASQLSSLLRDLERAAQSWASAQRKAAVSTREADAAVAEVSSLENKLQRAEATVKESSLRREAAERDCEDFKRRLQEETERRKKAERNQEQIELRLEASSATHTAEASRLKRTVADLERKIADLPALSSCAVSLLGLSEESETAVTTLLKENASLKQAQQHRESRGLDFSVPLPSPTAASGSATDRWNLTRKSLRLERERGLREEELQTEIADLKVSVSRQAAELKEREGVALELAKEKGRAEEETLLRTAAEREAARLREELDQEKHHRERAEALVPSLRAARDRLLENIGGDSEEEEEDDEDRVEEESLEGGDEARSSVLGKSSHLGQSRRSRISGRGGGGAGHPLLTEEEEGECNIPSHFRQKRQVTHMTLALESLRQHVAELEALLDSMRNRGVLSGTESDAEELHGVRQSRGRESTASSFKRERTTVGGRGLSSLHSQLLQGTSAGSRGSLSHACTPKRTRQVGTQTQESFLNSSTAVRGSADSGSAPVRGPLSSARSTGDGQGTARRTLAPRLHGGGREKRKGSGERIGEGGGRRTILSSSDDEAAGQLQSSGKIWKHRRGELPPREGGGGRGGTGGRRSSSPAGSSSASSGSLMRRAQREGEKPQVQRTPQLLDVFLIPCATPNRNDVAAAGLAGRGGGGAGSSAGGAATSKEEGAKLTQDFLQTLDGSRGKGGRRGRQEKSPREKKDEGPPKLVIGDMEFELPKAEPPQCPQQ
uniref:Uncharacterized protein n=1 Tax=Chromera velia CCMP2878 TaxID=1169474 RepID=A0A0G4F265_9ALVE|eukprot:Cvel_2670.t1-p1 / transcript=Cvel_2670.t1 / gene=Cvel_2670 / organism=Chromera_velia_CCMP2878 / gene_product=hypothetical protein / transcript_product=hypothetical protein / location=Cvel_scaffold106:106564-116636(-) / protein_length=1117 / sequence_SO=supercontig / SO=protein_coding / is_pseudo=false